MPGTASRRTEQSGSQRRSQRGARRADRAGRPPNTTAERKPHKLEKAMAPIWNDPRVRRGMEAQLQLRRSRLAAGDQPIGWKVGFSTPAAMERLGTAAPLVGFLTDAARLPSGATCRVEHWTKPGLEPEIAVHLGGDVAPGSDEESARRAIAALGPAIELVDVDAPTDDPEALLAGNVIHRHVLLGDPDLSRAGGDVAGVSVEVQHQGQVIAATQDPQAATGGLVGLVRHVADVLGAFGESLDAGSVVITGSTVPLILPDIGGRFDVRLAPMGRLSVTLDFGTGRDVDR